MTINGADDGLVLGADGALFVQARFFGWASHNSMPILQRTISWGDFTPAEPPSKGWYKNQKPLCSPDISDENAVGECRNMLGLTCSEDTDCPENVECRKINHKLKVYAGPEHPHAAQQPKEFVISQVAQ